MTICPGFSSFLPFLFASLFQLSYFQICRLEYKPKLPSVFFQPFTLAGMDITAVISSNPALVQRIFPLTHNLRAIDIVPVQQLMDADPWTTALPPSSFLFRFWRPTPRYHHASFLGSCGAHYSSGPPCVPSVAASPSRSEGGGTEGDTAGPQSCRPAEAAASSTACCSCGDGRAGGTSSLRQVDSDLQDEEAPRGHVIEQERTVSGATNSGAGSSSSSSSSRSSRVPSVEQKNDGDNASKAVMREGRTAEEENQEEGGGDIPRSCPGGCVTWPDEASGRGGVAAVGGLGTAAGSAPGEIEVEALLRPGQGLTEKKGECQQPPKFLGVHGGGLALRADAGIEAAVSR